MDANKKTLLGAILVLTIALAACTTGEADQSPVQSAALVDTEWVLGSLNGNALIGGREVTLRFGEASVEGSGGCNTYGGSYTASKDNLRLSGVYATEMACMEPKGIMEQEQAYFQALNAVASYRVSGERLELFDEGGAQTLVYVAAGGPSPA